MDYGSIGASEILGAAEILGAISDADFHNIVGAAPAHARARLHAARKSIVDRAPTRERRLVSGITPTSVTSTSEATISVQPQQMFRTERVVVPSNIAFNFSILDVKVGNRSQFVTSGEVPAATFTEVAIDAYVHWDTANIGNLITLLVSNFGTSTLVFRGTLFGTAAID